MINTNKHITKTVFIAMGCVVAVVLSFLEGLLPQMAFMPVGAKPGLSNIVTMLTSCFIGIVPSLMIAIVKSAFVGITRGFTAFLMSISGGILSTVVAYIFLLLKKRLKADRGLSFIFIGMIAALSHNMAQLVVASILISNVVYYYIPALMIFSVVSGIVTGTILKLLIPLLSDKFYSLNCILKK